MFRKVHFKSAKQDETLPANIKIYKIKMHCLNTTPHFPSYLFIYFFMRANLFLGNYSCKHFKDIFCSFQTSLFDSSLRDSWYPQQLQLITNIDKTLCLIFKLSAGVGEVNVCLFFSSKSLNKYILSKTNIS